MTTTKSAVATAREVLSVACNHVRLRSRTPTYFEHADRFAAAFLGRSLGASPEHYKAVGTDLAVLLDTCYEEMVPAGESAVRLMRQTTARLQEMLDPSSAPRMLPALRVALDAPECAFVDVASSLLAAVVTLGHASLAERTSVAAADDWVSFWGDRVWRHNRQQELHCGCCVLRPLPDDDRARVLSTLGISPAELGPRSKTFADGVREYLTSFSDTAAAAMALVGALPFADRFGDEDLIVLLGFLRSAPDLLGAMNELLRLAQDVRFDPSEPLSCGIFALAAERGSNAADLDVRALNVADLEQKLDVQWRIHARDACARMEACLASLPPGGALRPALAEIVGTACIVADALTGAPHKG